MNLKELAVPFPPEDIEWRVQRSNGERTSALAVPYVTNRAIMARLDEVCGPENWQNSYQEWRDKGILSGIGIRVENQQLSEPSEWVWKYDGADATAIEATKGGFSSAMKRAGVPWGIGRYLYGLDAKWVAAKPVGPKGCVITEIPTLPAWALPEGYKGDGKGTTEAEAPAETVITATKHKRLEALISKKGFTRDQAKLKIARRLTEITGEEWHPADVHLNKISATVGAWMIDGLAALPDKAAE